MPSRTRVLMVPSGSWRRSAISDCDSPSKYASSIASPLRWRQRLQGLPHAHPPLGVIHRAGRIAPPVTHRERTCRADPRPPMAVIRSRRRPRAHQIERATPPDHGQPSRDRPARRLEPGCVSPRLGERLDHDLLGVRALTHDPIRDGVQHPAVAVVQRRHGALVATPRRRAMSSASLVAVLVDPGLGIGHALGEPPGEVSGANGCSHLSLYTGNGPPQAALMEVAWPHRLAGTGAWWCVPRTTPAPR